MIPGGAISKRSITGVPDHGSAGLCRLTQGRCRAKALIWKCPYWAADKAGNTVDFLLRAHRDKAAAHICF